ncbi:unnamed protein product [Ranitomeya imitator]|uniref:Uncharacterized protein n=1 Tax=Ranitomeya imitator TaxID=111125 RepID=A0ABN9L292_9NEOB|nr:unnamed protein product [Ranitomeya imitator]
MDSSFYHSMVRQHLDDSDTYMPIDRDPTKEITCEIQQIVKSFLEQNVIDAKLGEYLINAHPIVPVFYALPKIHKHPTRPPGRPIVASTDSLLSPLAKTVEKILTPLLGHIVSFIKDTPDFLEDQFFVQRVGTAMGSNMAPPYANIFMAYFEEKNSSIPITYFENIRYTGKDL